MSDIAASWTDSRSSTNEDETKKVLKRMTEYANDTIPEGYTCEPTDSWKIWFGPSEKCLLINTTRRVAFKVDRGWWQKHYQTTIYVDRELLKSNDLMDNIAKQYSMLKRYVPRTPVVDKECKLPRESRTFVCEAVMQVTDDVWPV